MITSTDNYLSQIIKQNKKLSYKQKCHILHQNWNCK